MIGRWVRITGGARFHWVARIAPALEPAAFEQRRAYCGQKERIVTTRGELDGPPSVLPMGRTCATCARKVAAALRREGTPPPV